MGKPYIRQHRGKVRIMITFNKNDLTGKVREVVIDPDRGAECKIAKEEDRVILRDRMVPVPDQDMVHLFHVISHEWAVETGDTIRMTKVEVTDEEDISTLGPAGWPDFISSLTAERLQCLSDN